MSTVNSQRPSITVSTLDVERLESLMAQAPRAALPYVEALETELARASVVDPEQMPADIATNTPISLTLRPEAVSLGKPNGQDIELEGTVSEVNFLGSVIRLRVDLGRNSVNLDTFNDQRTPPPALNERVKVSINSSDVLLLN